MGFVFLVVVGFSGQQTERRRREDTDATLQREQERGALLGKYRAVWSSGIRKAEAKQSWLEVYSVGLHLI